MRSLIVASCLLFLIPGLTVSATAQTMVLETNGIAMTSREVSLEAIRQRGKLRVGVKDNLRPLGFRDGQGE